ncbi:MAG: hypothetical protein PHD07_00595 [Bacteroidales bacterium]|nr:hypothetical protein [Bacteroidales bacterium]MDD3201925.1 hypothetical protein [Bacteroidales bacterium]
MWNFPVKIESATVYEMILNTPLRPVTSIVAGGGIVRDAQEYATAKDTGSFRPDLSAARGISRPKIKSEWLIMAAAGVTPDISYGIPAGWVRKKVGFYLNFRSNFKFFDTAYSCSSDGKITGESGVVWSDGTSSVSRMNLSAGTMLKATKWLYPYLGVGYGSRIYAIKDSDGNLVKVTDCSNNSVSADVGVVVKAGKVAMSVGVTTIAFKYLDLTVGLGLMFEDFLYICRIKVKKDDNTIFN